MKLHPRFPAVVSGALLTAALLLNLTPAGRAADVDYFILGKGQEFMQTNAGPAGLSSDTNGAYQFIALANASSNGAIERVSVSNNVDGVTLESENDGEEFFASAAFTSKTNLDQTIAPGVYVFTIVGVNDGTNTAPLTLGADAYPSTPHVANWTDLRNVDPFAPVVVRWDPFVNGGPNDFIQLQIRSSGKGKEGEEEVFSSPEVFAPGALNGLSNSIVIPAGVLEPNYTYQAQLLFVNVATINTNVYPGARGVVAFFKESVFPLVTETNPPQGRIQFASANYVVSETAPSAEILLTRLGGSEGEVTVHFATAPLTATAGVDYSSVSTSVTFAPGVTNRTVFVPIIDDLLLDANERVRLGLSNPQGGVLLTRGTNAILTIEDDEIAGAGLVSFSAARYEVNETNHQVAIVVRRIGGTAGVEISASVEIVSGTATRGDDYNFEGKRLTFDFGPGQTSRTNFITIIDDQQPEGNEEIALRIVDVFGGARLGAITNATVLILDNEITIQFASATYTNLESVPVANILVERTGPPGVPVSVHYQAGSILELGGVVPVRGTATEGIDYLGTNGVLEFPAGVVKKSFQVRVLNDNLAEDDETVLLRLSGPSENSQLGSRRDATLIIRDTDAGGIIQFGFTNVNVRESAGFAMLMVTRTSGLASNVHVHIETDERSASEGADYTGFSSNLVFRAQEVLKTIKVRIINDTVVEDTEHFFVRLSEPSGGASLGEKDRVRVNILDNDVGGVISFARPEYSTNENGGFARILVTRTGGAASDVTVRFTTADGTNSPATAGDDYTDVNKVLTFDAGQLSQVVMVPILDDQLAEGTETVLLRLRDPDGGARLGVSNAVLRILDDESSLSFSSATYDVAESSPIVNITVVRGGANTTTARVDFATSDLEGSQAAEAGTDYVGTNFTLVFPPGVLTRVVPIRIRPDTLDETNEVFEVRLSDPSGAQLGSIRRAVVTIRDNDTAGIIQFSDDNYSVSEGTALAPIKIVRTGGAASGVTVHFQTGTGTAAAGVDYTAISTNLTFAAGETMKIVRIPIAIDSNSESAETVPLILSVEGGNAVLGSNDTATLTINNRPDSGFVPLAGPEFFKVVSSRATNIVFSRTFNADSVTVTPPGIVSVINGESGGISGVESFHLSAPITRTGVVTFDDTSLITLAYTREAATGSFGFSSTDPGDGGVLIIDGFSETRVSGRVNAIMSENGDPTKFIRVVVSFRAIIE